MNVTGTVASSISAGGTTFNGIHLNNNTFTVADVTGDANPDLLVSAALLDATNSHGGGSVGLTKAGAGTMQLSAANSYTGLTTVGAGILQLAVGGSLSTGDALTTSGTGSFDIDGVSQTLGLVTNGSSSANAMTNSSATAATLTIGGQSTGAGAYSGKMNIIWNQGSNASAISGSFTNVGNITLNANGGGNMSLTTGSVNNTGTITNSGSGGGSSLISAAIGANVIGVIQSSATSSLTLGGSNSYTGPTTVSAGTLTLSASSTNNIASSARINVASGATLSVSLNNSTLVLGTNQILSGNGNVTGSVNAGSGTHISPLNAAGPSGIGTLAISSALTLGSGSNLDYTLGSTGNSSLTTVGAGLTLPASSGTVTFNITDNAGAGSLGSVGIGTYKLFTFAPSSLNNFTAGNGVSTGTFRVGTAPGSLSSDAYSFTTTGNEVDLAIVAGGTTGSWSLPVNASVIQGATGTIGATLTNNGSTTLQSSGYTVAASGGTGITYSTPASVTLSPGANNAYSFSATTSGSTALGANTITLAASGSGFSSNPANVTATLNVYNHSLPKLYQSGSTPTVIVGGSLTAPVTLDNTTAMTSVNTPAPLDVGVGSLSNLTGATGSLVVASNGTASYTTTALSTAAVGAGQTQSVGLSAGDSQTVAGANALGALSATVTYNVQDHATFSDGTGAPASFTGGTLHLLVHQGGSAASSDSLTVQNGQASDYRAALAGSGAQTGGSTSGLTLSPVGGSGQVTPGSSANITASITGAPMSSFTQQFTYTFADDSILSGASLNVGTASINVIGTVYTGQSTWTGTSGGAWSSNANWVDNSQPTVNAAPGLDPNFTTTDTATFGNTSGNPVNVNLGGANPSLNAITFNSTGSYAISGSGTITLAGAAPTITVAGTHTIGVAVALAADTAVTVTGAADQLTISGAISGNQKLTLGGAGTLVLSNGTNSYSGGTVVSSGTLRVANAGDTSATGSGDVTLNGGTLASASVRTVSGNSIGGTVRAGTGAHTIAPGGVGAIGYLTVGGLNLNNHTTLAYDISSTSNLDGIIDNGPLALSSTGVNVAVPTGLAAGTYALLQYSSTSLTDASGFELNGGSTPAGYSLNLSSDELDLDVVTVGPSPAISIAASHSRFLAGTTVTGVISGNVTNGGGADFNFTSIVNKAGVSGTLVSASISPQSGTAQANNGNSVPWTATVDGTSATAGTSYMYGATVSDGTNSADSANVTLTAVATRTVNAPASTPLGRMITGSIVNVTSNGTTYTYGTGGTGAHGDTEDATVASYGGSPDANGITLSGGPTTANSTAGVTLAFTGTITGTGSTSGSLSVGVTGELSGAESPIAFAYTADPVAMRTITNGTVTNLGAYHAGQTINVTSNPFTTSGTHDTTTDVQVAAGSGTADGNGVTLSGGPTMFTGTTTSDTRTFGGTAGSVGNYSGSFPLAVTSLENLPGEGSYSNVTVGYTVAVTNGLATWTAGGSGSWSTNANWTDTAGVNAAPGVYGPSFLADTATFGGTASSTITLDSSNPSLAKLTFNDPATGLGYTIAQGSGTNRVTLNGNGSPAAVQVNGGTHNTISAPVTVAASGANFTGSGMLALSGAGNAFDGPVTVGDGSTVTKLIIDGGSMTPTATVASGITVTVAANSTLELVGTQPALVDSANLTNPHDRAAIHNSSSFVVGDGVNAAAQQVAGIDGAGTTTVSDSASLTADHINQSSLVIGNGSTFTLAPSDMNGNAMAAVQGSGSSLVLAGSLTPASSFVASGGSLLGAAGSTPSAPSVPLGGGLSGASVSAVPEPSAIILLLVGGFAAWPAARRYRRSRKNADERR